MTEPVRPDDPHWGAYVKVQQWHNTVECLPTWDEIREMEFIRQSGSVNMFELTERFLFERGCYAALMWHIRCREHRTHWSKFYEVALDRYQLEHGPREGWFTEVDRANLLDRELELEEQRTQVRLDEVRRARQKLGVKRGPRHRSMVP